MTKKKSLQKPEIYNENTIQIRKPIDYFRGRNGKKRLKRFLDFDSSILNKKN